MSDATTTTPTATPPTTPPTTGQKIAAELLGTFVLVLLGCGAVVFSTQRGAPTTTTTIGLTFGLSVTVMVYAVGRISGGHFNPAVSVGAAVGGRMAWHQVPVYVLGQLAGAILGAAVLFLVAHGFVGFRAGGGMGQNGYGVHSPGNYAWWATLVLELVMTMLFVLVILAVTDARNEHPALAPLAIGLALAAIHFVAIPADGTSVNPARSIGPAIFAGTDAVGQLWVFVLAPLLGGAAAGVVYPLLFGHGSDPVVGSGLRFGAPAVAVPGYGAPDQYQQQWNQQPADHPAAQPAAPNTAQDTDPWLAAGWTPEQIAAWEAEQGLPAGAAQSWTQEQIDAWHAQRAQQGAAGAAWSESEADRTQIRPPE